MKTQLHQQKSDDLQGNWLELVLKKKKIIILKTCNKNQLLRAMWSQSLVSATLCTDLQSISWIKSNFIFEVL